MFSSKSLIVWALTFRSLIHFELIFVYGVRQGFNFILCMWISVVPAPFVERLFFSIELSWHIVLVENQLTTNVRVYFWTLNSIPLICMSISMPLPNSLDYCHLVVNLNSRGTVLQLCSSFSRLSLNFHMNFRISLSIFSRKAAGILMGMHFQFLFNAPWALAPPPPLGFPEAPGIFFHKLHLLLNQITLGFCFLQSKES